jgi:hypothetical protein
MNKLMGFFELRSSSLPVVPWEEYHKDSLLDDNLLWTIRTAVFRGDDLNLPRLIGCNSFDAKIFADKTLDDLDGNGIVIYYPFFIAEKSGTMNVFKDKIVIEAVKKDLWNLVTYSDRDVTVFINEHEIEYDGNKDFLTSNEISDLCSYIPKLRHMFRDFLIEGKSVLVEWSFAYNSDINKEKTGDEYLVFYEARTI